MAKLCDTQNTAAMQQHVQEELKHGNTILQRQAVSELMHHGVLLFRKLRRTVSKM